MDVLFYQMIITIIVALFGVIGAILSIARNPNKEPHIAYFLALTIGFAGTVFILIIECIATFACPDFDDIVKFNSGTTPLKLVVSERKFFMKNHVYEDVVMPDKFKTYSNSKIVAEKPVSISEVF